VPTHDLAEFFHYLNVSPWKIAVSETGLGVPFTNLMTSIAGASKTLVYSECPYAKDLQPDIGKGSISQEMAEAMADRLWEKCSEFHSDTFATVAVTGAHKNSNEVGETHAWICVRVGEAKQFLHFKLPPEHGREEAIAVTCRLTAWLLDGILLKLLKMEDWLSYLPEISPPVAVDVFPTHGIPPSKALDYCTPDNPLVYHNGEFRRATPYLRQKDLRIYRGSFNPPTLAHQAMGEGALFELSLTNVRKEKVDLSDIADRLQMLDRVGVPVLITCGHGYFVELHKMLLQYQSWDSEIIYIVGGDTFRDIVSPDYIPESNFLVPLRDRAKFWVYNEPNVRMGKTIHSNAATQEINYSEMPWPEGLLPIRSSYVRDDAVKGNPIRGVDPRVAEYIHLYAGYHWKRDVPVPYGVTH
jgi:nicotinic acid mononucleotide adenylyltransferase/nicotinamide mononucleotide (NMN) deamidase PncC